MKIMIILAVIAAAVLAFVQLSHVRIGQKHDIPAVAEDITTAGGFTAIRPLTAAANDVIARIEKVAQETPRTTKLSDDPLRFVTRSRLMGFADVTTIAVRDEHLVIHAHLTVGAIDLGVNKARVLNWLDRLGPL